MGMLWRKAPGAGAATPPALAAQGADQPVQGSRTGCQQRAFEVGIQSAMVRFISGHPLRQQGVQPAPTGLLGRKPNRLENRQQLLAVILAGPTGLYGGATRWRRPAAQGANRGLAMIAQQLDGLIQQLAPVLCTGTSVLPPHPV